MIYSKRGEIAKFELSKTFEIRKNIKLHEWVIMPNHVHILMEIKYQNYQLNKCRDVARYVSTNLNYVSTKINNNENLKNFSKISPKPNTISSIIRSFKSATTHQINPQTIFFGWQPRFHDEIIKDEKELLIVRKYIKNNVVNWEKDKYFTL